MVGYRGGVGEGKQSRYDPTTLHTCVKSSKSKPHISVSLSPISISMPMHIYKINHITY